MIPKILVLATGGTIAAAGYAGERQLRADDLLASGEATGIEVITEDLFAVGSSDFTAEHLWRLARRIAAADAADASDAADAAGASDITGVVVTQGTDAIEETAFFLDLLHNAERPVVVTGAMRLPASGSPDGPRNLANAIRLAACPAVRGFGVLVTLNDEIHAAREVRKTHALAVDAFTSPAGGPLGYLDGGRIHLVSRPLRRVWIDGGGGGGVEPRVELVTAVVGGDGRPVRDAVAAGARGIVVELFGRGNAPDDLLAAIAAARQAGVAVVLTSRTGNGRVAVRPSLRDLGVIAGEDVDGRKARMVLMAALGGIGPDGPADAELRRLQGYFDRLGGRV